MRELSTLGNALLQIASEIRPGYNEASLLERVEVRVRGAAGWTAFVDDIDYDAKGQRGRRCPAAPCPAISRWAPASEPLSSRPGPPHRPLTRTTARRTRRRATASGRSTTRTPATS